MLPRILDQIEPTAAARKRVGLTCRRPPYRCVKAPSCSSARTPKVGRHDVGRLCPSVGAPIAMGYVPTSTAPHPAPRSPPKCAASVWPVAVAPMPFRSPSLCSQYRSLTHEPRYFTEDHEWIDVDGDVATVGITDYAQGQLGDVVFVDLPASLVAEVTKGGDAAVVESVKAASTSTPRSSGSVTEGNDRARGRPRAGQHRSPKAMAGSSACRSATR